MQDRVYRRHTPGFNIGAAGQPPGCRNSPHPHRTAELRFVLKVAGRCSAAVTARECIAERGAIVYIPTGIFRAFENVGTDYGMIMAFLGGDDAGGGMVRPPQAITYAKDCGLVLDENGMLYDSKKGQTLPQGVAPMPLLTEDALNAFLEPTTTDVMPATSPATGDLMALSDRQPARVIGANGGLRDRPGFKVDFLSRNSLPGTPYALDWHELLMLMRCH